MSTAFRSALLALLLLSLVAPLSFAGDDPSIQGELRQGIHKSMKNFIDQQTIDGVFRHYDPVDGKLLHLTKPNLHSGIVKKGDFYVSCADFVDQMGRKLDVDFLLVDAGGDLRTVQALVHKVEGHKRPYDVETR